MADEGDQRVGLIVEPFLAAEEEEQDDHRRANEVIVEVASDDIELRQFRDELVHFSCSNAPRDEPMRAIGRGLAF
jgi:hypothetical protein